MNLPEPYVIFFGALARWQGVGTMLKAVQHPDWPKEVTLVIVGDGVERAIVEDVARRCPRVQYLGRRLYHELPGLIARAVAGLVPSNNLGGRGATGLAPLKLLETLACGVPVVVTDFPPMADLVRTGRCGLVIPPDDPGALAAAVAELWASPEKRGAMGAAGRALVEQDHSWDCRAEATHKILLDVVTKGVV